MSSDRRNLKSIKELWPIRTIILYALCVFSIGCYGAFAVNNHVSRSQQKAPKFLNALSDFEFVGSGAYRDQLSVPLHGMEKQDLPVRFEKGRAYIFHHTAIDNQHLLPLLRDRLEVNGCKILEFVDKGPGRFIGGLSFRIRFEDDRYKGVIYNTLDNQIVNSPPSSKPLSPDDYVLVIEREDDPPTN